jgi:hypothetical protein
VLYDVGSVGMRRRERSLVCPMTTMQLKLQVEPSSLEERTKLIFGVSSTLRLMRLWMQYGKICR